MIAMIAKTHRLRAALELGRACLARVVEIEFVERSVALSSMAFTALIPMGVVVGSLSPATDGNGVASMIVRSFELDGQTRALVEGLFAPPDEVRSTVSVVGLVLVTVSALAFTRGLQRVYERSWRLPRLGVRGTPAGLAWLAAVALFVGVFAELRMTLIDAAGPVLATGVALSFSTVIWLVTPYTLLSRRVGWRPLLPTTILSALSMSTLGIGSTIYMPEAIANSAARYGEIGVTISLVSWLVAVGFVVVCCAAVGAVLAEQLGLTIRREAPPSAPSGWLGKEP